MAAVVLEADVDGFFDLDEAPGPRARAQTLKRLARRVVTDCSSCLALEGAYVKALVRRANALEKLGHRLEAIEDLEAALAADVRGPALAKAMAPTSSASARWRSRASLQPKHRSAPPPPRPEALTDDDIPVLDIARLMRGEYDETDVRALGRACASPGFFHVVNHGVPAAVIANFEAAMRDFFATNAGAEAAPSGRRRTRGLRGRRVHEADADVRRCHNQLPDGLPGFAGAVEAYYDACARVCDGLLRGVAASLDLDPGAFDGLFGGGHTSYLRMNYYPPHAGASASR
ncbi:iron ascorbate-dependent oxidoreductase [Aureococcus anophagefferens]|nr:iron ascorbate-dependent oxidoreductase [Aureococcus anophagefferens]